MLALVVADMIEAELTVEDEGLGWMHAVLRLSGFYSLDYLFWTNTVDRTRYRPIWQRQVTRDSHYFSREEMKSLVAR